MGVCYNRCGRCGPGGPATHQRGRTTRRGLGHLTVLTGTHAPICCIRFKRIEIDPVLHLTATTRKMPVREHGYRPAGGGYAHQRAAVGAGDPETGRHLVVPSSILYPTWSLRLPRPCARDPQGRARQPTLIGGRLGSWFSPSAVKFSATALTGAKRNSGKFENLNSEMGHG